MTSQNKSSSKATTVDDAEIARFSAMAQEWWSPKGKFRPLHKFNPTRVSLFARHSAQAFQTRRQCSKTF